MLNWDSAARRYVEGDDLPMTTFGPLNAYGMEITKGDHTVHKAWVNGGRVYPPTNDNAPVAAQPADRGPYIGTLTGRFYPFDPRPEEVDITHVAHSLAMTCRYTGSCIRFYSTAEHSVHIARWLLPRHGAKVALSGLLHDAPEALSGFGDTARPSKVKAPIIKETEERIYSLAVAPSLGLDSELPAAVHEADNRIIADEMTQNMREVDPAYTNPLGVRLEYWPPGVAELYFLDLFGKLTGNRRRWAA